MRSNYLRAAVACTSLVAPLLCTAEAAINDIHVAVLADELDTPWGLALLPDGRMLVTEKPGRLRIVSRDGKLSPPVAGVPAVMARGQGGLHDVILDNGFAQNRTI